MIEIDNFYNNGFGWICKSCESETKLTNTTENQTLPRVWREGEAETKQPVFSAPLAKWLDAARTQLVCPRCSIMEIVNKA